MALQDLVFQAVKENGGRTAVIFDDSIGDDSSLCSRITYHEMWGKVEEIKTALDNFLKQDQVVGVLLKPSCDLPSILISILSSSCAFWPLSSDGLKYRINGMRRVQASWILIQSSYEKAIFTALDHSKAEVVSDDILLKYQLKLIRLTDAPLVCPPSGVGTLAYCITTSGTTSSPKVVKVPHSCIVPNVLSIKNIFDVRCTDKFLLCSPLTFDPSMIDIFVSLSCGAALLIVPDEVKKNPANLLNIIYDRQAVTVLQATPSLIGRFSPHKLRKTILGADTYLRVLALGGEQFPTGVEMSKWVDPANRTQFFNLYGITEVSCWASYEQVDVKMLIEYNKPVPIGKTLDKTMVKVSPGSPSITPDHGNILIGSAERVCVIDDGGVTDHTTSPVAHIALDSDTGNMKGDQLSSQTVIWRDTGDLGKVMPDGSILCLGRTDDQIKRNGKRLNISTLQEECCQIHGVSDCRVLLSEENALVAFISVADDQIPVTSSILSSKEQKFSNIAEAECDTIKKHDLFHANSAPLALVIGDKNDVNNMDHLENERKGIPGNMKNPPAENSESRWDTLKEDLIKHIKKALPSYYMPDAFFEVSGAFPVTAHGKLDKKCLLNMNRENQINTRLLFKSPQLWALKLWLVYLPEGIEEINADDNFLSLGGDSLAAVGLISTMREVIKDASAQFLDVLFNKSFQQFIEALEMCLYHDLSNKTLKEEFSSVKKIAELHGHVEKNNMIPGNGSLSSLTDIGDEVYEKKKKILLSDDSNISLNFKSGPVLLEDTEGTHNSSSGSGNRLIMRGNRTIPLDSTQFKNQPVPHQSCQLFQSKAGNEIGNSNSRSVYIGKKLNFSLAENDVSSIQTQNDSHPKQNVQPHVFSSTKNSSKQKEGTFVSTMKYHLNQAWKFNTEKCVDASPTIAVFEEKMLVFCGSHSGHFSAIDVKSAEVLWTAILPDRIESSACASLNLRVVVVGCYDGGIYCLSTLSGKVEWSFKTQDIVKCSPMVNKSNGYVMCGSHDGNMYCLDIENKKCVWQKFLGGGGILASPLIKDGDNMAVVASLRGKVWALRCSDGAGVWCTDLKKPIFSSPCLHNNSVLIGCTDNTLFCLSDSGSIEWRFKTEGPIFSSPASLGQCIIFGCHDCHIYCLSSTGQLKWSLKGKATIFSTPFIFLSQNGIQELEQNSSDKTCLRQDLPSASKSSKTISTSDNLSNPSVITKSNNESTHLKRPAEIKEDTQSFICDESAMHDNALNFQQPPKKAAKYAQSSNRSSQSQQKQPLPPVTSCLSRRNSQLHWDTENEMKHVVDKPAAIDCSMNKNTDISNILTEGETFVKTEGRTFVIVASSNGILYVLDVDSGRVVAEEALPGEVFSSPVVCDDKVVVGCRDNFIYCYDFVS